MKERNEKLENRIIKTVAEVFEIRKEEIFGRIRTKEVAEVRQLIAYLLRSLAALSFPDISKILGGRDHTTAIYSFNKISKRMGADDAFCRRIKKIIEIIESQKSDYVIDKEVILAESNEMTKKEEAPVERNVLMLLRNTVITEREKRILEMYEKGLTLQKIAEEFGVTRERIRQIVMKTALKKISQKAAEGFEIDADEYVKGEKLAHETAKKPTRSEIEKEQKQDVKKRWSKYYIMCRGCGTTIIPHLRKGYCRRCVEGKFGKTREQILKENPTCQSCGMDASSAMRKFGREFYITKDGKVLCRGCFLNFTGHKLSQSRRNR